MKIVEATIRDFKRFTVSNINELNYKPKHKIQIILGTNGSGKSSLLRELIPVVDNDTKSNYKDKTGYKKVVYEHNNSTYILTYDASNRKFSFIKDNEELNITGQRKLQQQLIEEHFNINKLIYELLLGITGFSTMTINERKKWFTKILTHLDYTYALDTYKATKDRIRELKSYIKLTRAKISRDEYLLKKYDKDRISKVKEEIKELDDYFDYLVSLHKPYEQLDKPKDVNDKIERLIDLLNKLDDEENKKTIENIIKQIEETKKHLLNEKEYVTKELNELNNVKSNILEPEEIKKEFEQVKKELTTIKESFKVENLSEFVTYLKEFQSNYNNIVDNINTLKNLDIIEKDVYLKSMEDLKTLSLEYVKIENEIEHIKDHLDKLTTDDVKTMTCPNCGYVCSPNSDKDKKELYVCSPNSDKDKKELEDKLQTLITKKEKIEKEIKQLEEIIIKFDKRKEVLQNILSNFSNPKENPIFSLLMSKTDKFKTNLDTIHTLNVNLPDPYELNSLIEKYVELQQQIKTLENFNHDSYKLLVTRKQDLLKRNSEIISEINNLNSELEKYKRKLAIIREIETLHNDLLEVLKYATRYKNNAIKMAYNNLLTDLLNDIREIKSKLEIEYLEYAKVKDRYEKLEEELKEYEKRLQAAIELEKLLSPSKGIIGEYITKTINVILERMNEIINRIWTYDIEILPCDLEDSDLTFRFPVKVNNKEIIQDISKGSSSMKEVFDIAFKITAMEFLNMLDYPLILDEFGRTMDETHRIRAYNFIEEISKDYFSQVFIVSHFESMYARFVNTDVVVLDKSNLTFDINNYNSVVKIK